MTRAEHQESFVADADAARACQCGHACITIRAVFAPESGSSFSFLFFLVRFYSWICSLLCSLMIFTRSDKHPNTKLPPILHFSSSEPYTKYEMCLLLANLHQPALSHKHIIPDAAEPVIPPGGVGRPKDCRLSTTLIERSVNEGGLGMIVETQGFEDWWRQEINGSAAARKG